MTMSCTRCQFVAFSKLIPEIVGHMSSKTVLEIFILVVANNSAFDVFATTGTQGEK